MDNERRFYTYAYLREDRTPYYIGKGSGRRAFNPNRRVKVPPKNRVLFLKTGLTEEEAHRHEVYMIAVFGRKDLGEGILLNFTDGGEGCSGYRHTEETRNKMKRTRQNVPKEVGEKISRAKLGRKHSPETIQKLKQTNGGKKTPETKEKMRQASRLRWERTKAEGGVSDETREKQRQSALRSWKKRRGEGG